MHAKSQAHQTLALFDFDGTLYSQDSFTGFIFYALNKPHIFKRGCKILPYILAYYCKCYPAHKMRPRLFYSMFKGLPASEISSLAKDYARDVLMHALDPKMLRQLQQHQHYGHHVILVSASLSLFLQPCCDELNIHLLSTHIEIQNGVITGHYQSADCSGEQKKIAVSTHYQLNQYQHIYAYGNSDEDNDMLALAHFAYRHDQKQSLPIIIP